MTEERFKLADKVRNDLLYLKRDRKTIAESIPVLLPISNLVSDYILHLLDIKISELQKEFDSL